MKKTQEEFEQAIRWTALGQIAGVALTASGVGATFGGGPMLIFLGVFVYLLSVTVWRRLEEENKP